MNYLAHLRLAEKTPESIIGNFLGDFVKGSLDTYNDIYSDSILKGIKNHRQVDIFTDTHPIYLHSKKIIQPNRGRFSGIIIDIFYDHFLAKNWYSFSNENLEMFINNVYKTFQLNEQKLPLKLQQILPIMIQENWLLSYQKIEGISLTFKRLSRRFTRRFKRKNTLMNAEEELIKNYQELEQDFQEFFPDLLKFVHNNNPQQNLY